MNEQIDIHATDFTPDELRLIYERAKKDFSDEKLQEYLRREPGIPLENVIAELESEEFQRQRAG